MATQKEFIAQEVARAVGAGKAVAMESVNFSDPDRPKTCLEIDFPIASINQIAAIEGKGSGALKPVYQVSKWWARRRSTVFRALLVSAATKAPADPTHAAKLVWDNYYANHQKRGAFKQVKVADIFMGGGTTLVEGSRLGMQMVGNDLNPVAWFVVKQELADVDIKELRSLLADIEAEVKPQIMPFYYCDGPNGEKGTWTHKSLGKIMGADFDPMALKPEERQDYIYTGPEMIYTFWAKHGPCQMTGCGHRTPIMTKPLVASRAPTISFWSHSCLNCGANFDIEEAAHRLAPDAPLFVAKNEQRFTILNKRGRVTCPTCHHETLVKLGTPKKKKIELSVHVTRDWLSGTPCKSDMGNLYGGTPKSNPEQTVEWLKARSANSSLIEVRGLPSGIVRSVDSQTELDLDRLEGSNKKAGHFICAACGKENRQIDAFHSTGATAPIAAYAFQGHSPSSNDRFFSAIGVRQAQQLCLAETEWHRRKNGDLSGYWPTSKIPFGHETHQRRPLDRHGYENWSDFFNHRQLLVLSLILKSIALHKTASAPVKEYALSVFQQYLRNQNSYCFWNVQRALEPMFSSNDYHPKPNFVENSVFSGFGRGDFRACADKALESLEWVSNPWEICAYDESGHSEKLQTSDPVISRNCKIECVSATELSNLKNDSFDLVITDPPFGDLLQYSELSDFFYVWLRLPLRISYPSLFEPELTPKSLEVVSNKAREPDDPDNYYKRLLTLAWQEAHRILKPGGTLAFTFHHSADEPWVAVLESLFDAGFFLEATYPIRSDESKGDGEFGSKKIEYDIIHVCRKRTEEPKPVSWGRMRREVLADVRQLQGMLENHARSGLPAADLQVIRRGKALEYFSRHYGKVYIDDGRPISVKDALVGINQLIDEDANNTAEPPPVIAEPISRQFLRIFDGKRELARDQLQKLLRGSGISPDEFEDRGWCSEDKKVFHFVDPLAFARDWQGKHRRRLTTDLDQALVMIGACYDGSGINASDTLKNDHFKPHPALKSLLEWFSKRGFGQPMRYAASRALSIYNGWAEGNRDAVRQLSLFQEE